MKIFTIRLTDGRLFVATYDNLDQVTSELANYTSQPEDMDIEGPYDFLEIASMPRVDTLSLRSYTSDNS